jgi:hypothetical protein
MFHLFFICGVRDDDYVVRRKASGEIHKTDTTHDYKRLSKGNNFIYSFNYIYNKIEKLINIYHFINNTFSIIVDS